ncbi:MAG TPA: hypothetical protein VJJ79_01920 [Candidatus Nanoarchaeia archaeon]|nr:hypothetical protein [Candidatus Nanoarchaeia archaeon]
MKRGQIEILGFVVIVLLLFFSLVIYFQFTSKERTGFIGEAEQNLEVSNLLTAIRYYTVCDGTSLGDAIVSCANEGFACGKDACTLIETDVPALVDAWGWDEDSYTFAIDDTVYSPQECSGDTFVDDYTGQGITVRLTFCY